MEQPVVSIIIPVGPRHARYLPDALHSVMAQRVTAWEALVINDTGRDLALPALPGARVLDGPAHPADRPGTARASACRNLGLELARAPYALFLDADDALMPDALYALLRGAATYPDAGYVYGGWWNIRPGHTDYAPAPRYDRSRLLQRNLHMITALVPTAEARRIGGFNVAWEIYEDWEFWLRLGLSGCCGQPIPDPVLIYRTGAGSNREESYGRKAEIPTLREARYGRIQRGEEVPVGCCGKGKNLVQAAQRAIAPFGATLGAAREEATMGDERVRMEAPAGFSGTVRNPFASGSEMYRVTASNRYLSAAPHDVGWLKERGFTVLRRVETQTAPDLAPIVADADEPAIEVVAAGTEAESVAPKRRTAKKTDEAA